MDDDRMLRYTDCRDAGHRANPASQTVSPKLAFGDLDRVRRRVTVRRRMVERWCATPLAPRPRLEARSRCLLRNHHKRALCVNSMAPLKSSCDGVTHGSLRTLWEGFL